MAWWLIRCFGEILKGTMYMDEQRILIEILHATINETENANFIKEKITSENLISIFKLAKKHDLAHVVSNFIYQNKIDVDKEFQTILQREELLSVYRNEQMNYAFSEIFSAFDEIGIEYIPLKGAVIRSFYPYESMRTSCDIDILIHNNDLGSAINSLKSKGYICKDRSYHDVSLYSPNKIHLELHFNLQENIRNLDVVLKDAWKYSMPTNSNQCEFKKEFFVFHIFAHMAYHFVSGGCGIRSLLDIWVMKHKMGISYLCSKRLLEKAGIYQFASEMDKLAEQCFTNNNLDDFSVMLLKYIFDGGVYGSVENHIAIDKHKAKNSIVYAFKRLFLPYNFMVISYPFLKKAPYLLPFCWLIRCMKVIFTGKSKRILFEMSCVNNVSDEKIKEVKEICSRLAL